MGQSGLSQPIMSPYDAWKAGQHFRLLVLFSTQHAHCILGIKNEMKSAQHAPTVCTLPQ